MWDPMTQTLSWVDLHAGLLHRRQADTVATYALGAPLSAALPTPEGMLVVQGASVRLMADVAKPTAARVVTEIPLGAALRCNDAQFDPWGRLWVGSMAPSRPGAAALYYLESDGSSPVLAFGGLTLANGIGWSPDGAELYVVDTIDRVVFSAGLDNRGRPQTAFTIRLDLRAVHGVPDGLCVDADGGIWIALFGAGEVRCYEPSGELRQVIKLPVRCPTSVAFVGPGIDELVITTARTTPNTTDSSRDAGRLLAARPGVRGQGVLSRGDGYRRRLG